MLAMGFCSSETKFSYLRFFGDIESLASPVTVGIQVAGRMEFVYDKQMYSIWVAVVS